MNKRASQREVSLSYHQMQPVHWRPTLHLKEHCRVHPREREAIAGVRFLLHNLGHSDIPVEPSQIPSEHFSKIRHPILHTVKDNIYVWKGPTRLEIDSAK